MEFRQLGKSDIHVPVVCFGTWAIGGWMWGGSDDKAAIRAIQHGVELGVTCIDTAPMYGMGRSEQVVGQAIAGRRDRVVVATKCGLRWDLEQGEFFFITKDNNGKALKVYRNLRPESIRLECEQSLRRLGVDVIDLYQCHWPDSTCPLDDTMAELLQLRKEGKIRAIGVSNFTPEMMAACLKHGEVASDQPLYSPLNRGIEADVVPFCIEHKVGILAYSPLVQGLMTGKITLEREFEEDDLRHGHPWFTRENRQKVLDMLEHVKPIAENHDATLAQVALAWVVAQPGLTAALAGARNERQVEENAVAGDIQLAADEIKAIRDLVEALDLG